MSKNSLGAAAKLRVGNAEYECFRLSRLEKKGVGDVGRLPFSTDLNTRLQQANLPAVAAEAAAR